MLASIQDSQPSSDPATDRSAWFLVGQIHGAGHSGDVVHVPISVFPFVVGRRPDASLCLPRRTVSSNHAEILIRDEGLAVRDLDSTNGTYVNGQPVRTEVRLRQDDLVQFADVAMRVKRQAGDMHRATVQEDVYDQALALVQFDTLLNERRVIPYYQPIVQLSNGEHVSYEVLARSRLYGLETPLAMFRAAEKLNLEAQLSGMLRWEGILKSAAFPELPHLFVNTHPAELRENTLRGSMKAVRELSPSQRLTLEIHESCVTNPDQMTDLRDLLTDLDIGLAYDDFGAGQARLVELVRVPPDCLKFDIALIHDIDKASSQQQQMVATLVRMVQDQGIVTLAEGVETEAESQACADFGFQLAQGFFFGRPAPVECP